MNKLGFNGSGFNTLGFRGRLTETWREVVRFVSSVTRIWRTTSER